MHIKERFIFIQTFETWILGLVLGVWTTTLMFSVTLNKSVGEPPVTDGFQALCGYITVSVCIPKQCTEVPWVSATGFDSLSLAS